MSKKSTKPSGQRRQPHPEHQLRSAIMLGAAFVVVMLIAIGYRQRHGDMIARVYEPAPAGSFRAERIPDDMRAGACCAEGECLDLTRSECAAEGYVFWPDADLCVTACHVIR